MKTPGARCWMSTWMRNLIGLGGPSAPNRAGKRSANSAAQRARDRSPRGASTWGASATAGFAGGGCVTGSPGTADGTTARSDGGALSGGEVADAPSTGAGSLRGIEEASCSVDIGRVRWFTGRGSRPADAHSPCRNCHPERSRPSACADLLCTWRCCTGADLGFKMGGRVSAVPAGGPPIRVYAEFRDNLRSQPLTSDWSPGHGNS